MNYQEMIERLRDEHIAVSRTEAADCIEKLVKERDFILSNQTYSYLGKNLKRWLARDLEDAKDAAEAKLTECEARLGKAMEALREIQADSPSHGAIKYTLRIVLAELEGQG